MVAYSWVRAPTDSSICPCSSLRTVVHPVHGNMVPTRPRLYIASHLSFSIVHHLTRKSNHHILLFTYFQSMSDEQQQTWKEYSFDVVTLPNTVPPVPHNQATMPRECAVSSAHEVSLLCRVLTTFGCSRLPLHRKYHRMVSLCLHQRPFQLTIIHTAWAMYHTMGQFHL
jgi:hypothetical protein